MSILGRLLAGSAGSILLLGVLWEVAASWLLLAWLGKWDDPRVSLWHHFDAWFWFLPYAKGRPSLTVALAVSAVVPALFLGLLAYALARWNWRRLGGFRGIGQRMGVGRVKRSPGATYGDADYMSEQETTELFPSTPHPSGANLVVGELERVDLTPFAKVRFNPKDRSTWGNRGRMRLMFDWLKAGMGAVRMVIGGSGSYKTASLLTSLLYWNCGAAVQDPAGELYEAVGRDMEERGKTVIRLDLGDIGPNIMDCVDLSTEYGRRRADTRLRAIASRIVGPVPKESGGSDNTARFKRWGRAIILAFLADMAYRDDLPPHLKTLRALDEALSVDDDRVRDRLRGIHEASPSRLARRLASGVMKMPEETWGGAIANAKDDTEWLATEEYADLVSGNAFKLSDLRNGDIVVFNQIPMDVLEVTPAVTRVLMGAMIDAIFNARGRVNGYFGFFIDEAVLLGAERSLKQLRDQGRKFKAIPVLYYQSEWQIEEVWGKSQKATWFDSCAWRSYTSIASTDTAKDINLALGTYTAEQESSGSSEGTSGRFMELASHSKGGSTNRSETKRDLAFVYELLKMHSTERITFCRGEAPIRHAAAIALTRPELEGRIDQTSYQADEWEEEEELEGA